MSLKPFPEMVAAAKAEITETSIDEVRQRLSAGDAVVLVDVREDAEWNKSHIGGAIHLGRGVIDRDIAGQVPDPGTEVILYCASGGRSAMAAKALQDMGYSNVKSMAGGISAWNQAGYPVE